MRGLRESHTGTGGGPTFELEAEAGRAGHALVCGIDEAGRGPWAGPVVAAAVILNPPDVPNGLDDSKKLSARRRETLYAEIKDSCRVGVGIAEVERIDRDNILQATFWAMAEAVRALGGASFALVDGKLLPTLPCPATAVVKGDGRSLSIAASSIIAKVTRDRIMRELSARHPGYGWERNMGYGTAEHAAALRRLGVSTHHRRSFKPIRALLAAAG